MAIINQQNVSIKNGSTWYKMCPFPVGYVYLSYINSSPADTYGGTWSAMNSDRFIRLGNGATTGGSDTISVDNLPSHTHLPSRRALVYTAENNGRQSLTNSGKEYASYGWLVDQGKANGITPSQATGRGTSYYPSYQELYAWRRTE